ncbi:MAG: response regulator [Desulfobacteraceae bacterium]|nr:response regulator [Desulfobacteraceae bacterium]
MNQVLVAEDHPDQLRRIVHLLRSYEDRFGVLPARNGREAIQSLKTQPIDLVVTDIQMPEIDGIILLAYIHTYHPELPCFVTTAYGTSRLRAKLPEDILRFFHKPFDVDDLARAILTALEERPNHVRQRGISLAKFLHLIAMEQGTCQVDVESHDKEAGSLYFENGVLLHAHTGDLSGESAALAILSSPYSRYSIQPSQEVRKSRTVKADLSELIRNVYGASSPGDTA